MRDYLARRGYTKVARYLSTIPRREEPREERRVGLFGNWFLTKRDLSIHRFPEENFSERIFPVNLGFIFAEVLTVCYSSFEVLRYFTR